MNLKMAKLKYGLVLLLLMNFILQSENVFSQFTSARIGINGLTCSACTRSVEMSIRKLSFIENVEMNLENTDGILKFKKGQKVDISKIAQAVVDAGFSVRFLNADYIFSNTDFSDSKINDNGYAFYFVRKTNPKKESTIRFIGPSYQTKKEFNKYRIEFPSIDFNNKSVLYVVTVDSDK